MGKNVVFGALFLALTLGSRLALADCTSPASTHFVATTGSDSADGSEGAPWATINHAISKTGPGACVRVRAGSYDEGGEIWVRPENGGAAGQLWELAPYPGESVTLQTRVLLEGHYARVRGFEMASGVSIIAREQGSHNEVIGNHFKGAYTYAAISLGGDDLLAEDNVIELDGSGSTQDHGIYVLYGKGKVIRNNAITGSPGYGVHIYDENKYGWSPDISDVLVENNSIRGCVSRSGVIVAADSGVQVSNVKIVHNVLAENPSAGVTIWKDGISGVDVLNNTVVGGGAGVTNLGAAGVRVQNNLFWNTQTLLDGSFASVDTNLYGPAKSGASADVNPLYADPAFVNAGQGDYHLSAGSPAIDAGKDVGLAFVGSAPDLGAYEVGGNTGPGGTPEPGTGGSTGSGGRSSGGGSAGSSGGAPTGGAAGAKSSAASEDDGCGCRVPSRRRPVGYALLFVAGVALLEARRRRSA